MPEKQSTYIACVLGLLLIAPTLLTYQIHRRYLQYHPQVDVTQSEDVIHLSPAIKAQLDKSTLAGYVTSRGHPDQILTNIIEHNNKFCGLTSSGDFITYSTIYSFTKVELPAFFNEIPPNSSTIYVCTPDGKVHELESPQLLDDGTITDAKGTIRLNTPFKAYKSSNFTQLFL